MALNNNQAASVLNEAIAMSTGAEEIGTLSLEEIVDTGNDASFVGSEEQFTKALLNVLIRNWFTDSAYRSTYDDPFFQDSATYGAITQHISIELPKAQESHAWKDITSGETQLGQYTVYLPVVHTQVYGKTVSWEIPIAITGQQWDTAFRNAQELKAYVDFVFLAVDNGIVCHIKDMDRINRNNFIAEKFAYAETEGAKGVHVVNLVEEYAKHAGKSTMTVTEFRNSKGALNWASMQFKIYADYMREMSVLFNTAQRERFTPTDRLVVQVLSSFENDVLAVANSETYHNNIVALPYHQTIPFWQGLGTRGSFDEVSAINVEGASDGTEVEKSGIVALMVDRWAIMHTIFSRRVAVQRFEPEDITQYYNQFRDSYVNNLTMNGIVFVLADYEEVDAGGDDVGGDDEPEVVG